MNSTRKTLIHNVSSHCNKFKFAETSFCLNPKWQLKFWLLLKYIFDIGWNNGTNVLVHFLCECESIFVISTRFVQFTLEERHQKFDFRTNSQSNFDCDWSNPRWKACDLWFAQNKLFALQKKSHSRFNFASKLAGCKRCYIDRGTPLLLGFAVVSTARGSIVCAQGTAAWWDVCMAQPLFPWCLFCGWGCRRQKFTQLYHKRLSEIGVVGHSLNFPCN